MRFADPDSKIDYDVIVVGAGPGGSFAAKTAAAAGASVLLIDRRKEIGAPVRCGEGISQNWLTTLGLKADPAWAAYQIAGARLFSPEGRSIKVEEPDTKGYVVERKIFDKTLAADAGRAGADIMVKTEVTGVLKDGSKVTGIEAIGHDGQKFTARSKVLIAADGAESTVARMAGLNTVAALYDTDFGYEYEMVNVDCEPYIDLYFGTKIAPRGYVWIFPKRADVANVGIGIGGLEKPNAKLYLDKFVKEHPRLKKAQPIDIKGGAIPVGEPLHNVTADGLMVIGTAAHQVDPIHGGGMGLAADAGRIAGEMAAAAIKAGDVSGKRLDAYRVEWEKRHAGKMMSRLRLRKVLERLNDDDWNAVVGALGESELEQLLHGNFGPAAKKVILKRPQLLKIVGVLIEQRLGV